MYYYRKPLSTLPSHGQLSEYFCSSKFQSLYYYIIFATTEIQYSSSCSSITIIFKDEIHSLKISQEKSAGLNLG